MDFLQRRRVVSTRDAVYDSLREQILHLELAPGTPLSENEMALHFQVSRTPVRESFLRLAQEGLVQVLPQRGTFVSLIDPNLTEEARFMREHLEVAVIRLACERFDPDILLELETNLEQQRRHMDKPNEKMLFELDQQFHRLLFAGCGKLHTWAAMNRLTVHLIRIRLLKMSSNPNWPLLYEQHRALAEAVKTGDAAAASNGMEEHLRLNVTDQAELMERYPNYFL